MKRSLLFAFIALIAAWSAFAITKRYVQRMAPDEMTWLRDEFALTPAQVAAIEKLHADYAPICADHCSRIAQARKRLQAVRDNPQSSAAERASAEADWQALCNECTVATRQHLEAVAAQMSPEHGRRYLELVGPKLTQREMETPFGLR